MKIIEREMKSTENKTNFSNWNCQASFNSNGNITLRNYDSYVKDKDEIIILSDKETEAIFDLFRKLKNKDMLPF